MYGSATASVTDRPLDIYVDGNNGDDVNIGTIPDAPLATLAEAERRIPDVIEHVVKVWIEPSATPYDWATVRDRTMRSRLYFIGGRSEDDLGFTELLSSTAAQAGSSDGVIVTSGGLGVNTFRGKTVEVLTGNAAGDLRIIAEHTDTDITPVLEFSADVQDGDTFRIVESGVLVNLPAHVSEVSSAGGGGRGVLTGTPAPGLAMVNLRVNSFSDPEPSTPTVQMTGLTYWFGIDFDGSGIFGDEVKTTHQGFLYVGADSDSPDSPDPVARLPVEDFGAPNIRSWLSWGIGANATGTDFPLWDSCQAFIVGIVVDRFPYNDSRMRVQALRFFNGGVRDFGQSSVILDNGWSDIPGENTSLIVGTLGWGVEMLGDDSWLQVPAHVDVDATGGEAYICADDAKLEIIQGDITADVCIVARRGGRVLISGNLTCNSTTADTRVEDPGVGNTDQAIGGYGSVGSYIAAGDGSKIQRET